MRKAVLLLASMAIAMLLASGVALAQITELDQENAATTGASTFAINSNQSVAQTFTAGKSGGLDSVGLYLALYESIPQRSPRDTHQGGGPNYRHSNGAFPG